jgi:signal transduction histidine kinase
LSAVRRSASAELAVADEGPGIPPDDIPHLFERFYRGNGIGRRTKGGGLGLAIVKGFVGLSGGTVRVENPPGGARFVTTLSLDSPAPQTAART